MHGWAPEGLVLQPQDGSNASRLPNERAMRIAYLVSGYPRVSHTFIRREILALEALGIAVDRFSIRRCDQELKDPFDKDELARTRVILDAGAANLLLRLILMGILRPLRLARAVCLAVKMGLRSDRGLLRHLVYVAEACVLLQLVTKSQAEHVHAHFGTNSAAVAMLCRVLGGPTYSFTMHGSADVGRAQSISLGEKIARASFVVAVSHFGRSQICRYCSRDLWPRIHVVHCGVDDVFLKAPRTRIPDSPSLVCIGRLSEEKGHLFLLEAMSVLAHEGIGLRLELVGDGPLRNDVMRRIEELGLQDSVRVTGWASSTEVRDRILASRALVLPSLYEGLPVVIMEALALRRPVVSTYVGGVPELVEPGVCGWLVPPGSVEDLAAAMRQVLLAPIACLERMGAAGEARVRDRHYAPVLATQLASLFKASIERAHPCR